MNNLRSFTAVIALSAALAAPAFAQTSTAPANNPPVASPTANATASSSNDTSSSTGNSTYMTADKDVRASKVIGASVYNDHDQKIGTVDELLMDSNHDVTLVAVKIDRLSVKPDRIVMAGATKDGLTQMPTYTFSKS